MAGTRPCHDPLQIHADSFSGHYGIAASGYEVPAQRLRVPAWEKVWILARSLV